MHTPSQAKYPVVYGVEKKFSLRWRVVSKAGSEVCSRWDEDGVKGAAHTMSLPEAKEFFVDIKDTLSGEVNPLVSVMSDDFDEFRWFAAASANPMKVKGTEKLTGTIIGCIVVTRCEELTVMVSGEAKVEKIS